MSILLRCWRWPLAAALSLSVLYPGSAAAADVALDKVALDKVAFNEVAPDVDAKTVVDVAADPDAAVLTLADALARAQARNAGLKISTASVAAATATRHQAARLPNPVLSLAYDNVAGSGVYSGTDSAETTLAISQSFGGGRRERVDVAAVELTLAQDAQGVQRLELVAETARRFIAVVAAQEKLALAQRAEIIAASTRDDLDKRAAAARAPIAERNRARMAWHRARLAVGRAETDLLLARRQLAEQWDTGETGHGSESTADFSRASGDLFALPAVVDDSTLLVALERSPLRTTLRNSEKLRVAEIAQARTQGRSPVTASVGVRDFADTADNALLFGISLPIPLFNHNRGAIAAAEARLDAQRATNAIAQHDAELRILGLVAALKQYGEEARTLRNIALPLANEALEQTRYGFERGRFSWLELASVQQELIDTETAAIDAAAHYHTLLADLEALTGLALIAPSRSTGDTP